MTIAPPSPSESATTSATAATPVHITAVEATQRQAQATRKNTKPKGENIGTG